MKKILITGANKGIGLETAKQLARQGHHIFLGSRDAANGQKAVEILSDQGLHNVELVVIDIANIDSVNKAKQQLMQKTEVIDVLINNAGIAGTMPQELATVSVATLRHIFDTNFFGTIQTTQAFLPLLRKSSNPSIINVSSEVGSIALRTTPGRTLNRDKYNAYGSSKTALNAFTVMLANELKAEGIRVNSVTPGYTATNLNQFQGAKTPEQGAMPIVKLANNTDPELTAKFFNDDGEVPW